jgi:hypothetical protein
MENRVALKRHFSDEVSTQVGEPWNELLAMLSNEILRHRHPESKTYFPLRLVASRHQAHTLANAGWNAVVGIKNGDSQ